MRFPCVHAAATTPVQRLGVSPRSSHPAVSAFSGRGAGSACTSSFSRLARRSLTLRPAHSRSHQNRDRYPGASDISSPPCLPGCFRLERSPGGPSTHWKSAALSRRTWFAGIRTRFCVAGSRSPWRPRSITSAAGCLVLFGGRPTIMRGSGNAYYCLIKACCSAAPVIATTANTAPAANVAVDPTAVQSKPATTLAASNAAPVIKL